MILELIPYASLTLIIFIVLTCIALLLFHVIYQRCLLRSSSCSRTHGLHPSILKTLPVFPYSDIKGVRIGKGEQQVECAVCLSAFEGHEMLRLLPKCGHAFHTQCVDPWLAYHTTCPYCRGNLLLRTGEPSHLFVMISDDYGGDASDSTSSNLGRSSATEGIRDAHEHHHQYDNRSFPGHSSGDDWNRSLGSLMVNSTNERASGSISDNEVVMLRLPNGMI